ncbi:hypothetical protein BPLS_P5942 [Bathymodiolus platifrons methanotrophic gill symbiont]|uniref:hypothetical protein n=1 Tax=Bathymodiolus platifrons methanotrophic gill symbiont TaxID=113268 RepID=UPI0011C8DA27|nr:hypothetical protein [Bathymodiolus platifrons methanotrophic gill symbiont]TXL00920.1 hypothetical protein BMR02_04560 [Methylococcaceae bacterium HT1]TXL15527.1 hypothetical protein BMR05_03335 [Methylococcaceae bacterium HT4]GFO77477.1 hypothetical protein BPLS_P5942 [Bathymodiolus platifrons methanotrophic gill symbiont]
MKIITPIKEFLGSKREKFIAIGSAIVMMPFVLYAEGLVSNALAMMDPDLFGPGIEEVIASQDKNFKNVNEALSRLSSATEGDDKMRDIIAILSKNIDSTRSTNNELTSKLDSMYKDREKLRAELKRTKGGDLIPSIFVNENKSVNFKDVGVVALTNYDSKYEKITIRYKGKYSRRVRAGGGVEITSSDGKKECVVTYMGKYDDKFGLEKSCIEL